MHTETVAPPRRRASAKRSFIGPSAVAEQAEVDHSTVLRWLQLGTLKGKKVGGRWRIDPAALRELLGE